MQHGLYDLCERFGVTHDVIGDIKESREEGREERGSLEHTDHPRLPLLPFLLDHHAQRDDKHHRIEALREKG